MKATSKVTRIEIGQLAGLRIEEIFSTKLKGMKAVRVTHRQIAGFEARAFMAATTGTADIVKEVEDSIRLAI